MLIKTKLTQKMWEEIHTFCGKCGGEEIVGVNREDFQTYLVKQGWRYDTEMDRNICPACVKKRGKK